MVTLLVLARGLHVAAILSSLGVGGFIAWVLPAAEDEGTRRLPGLLRFWRINAVIALLTLTVWFILQSAVIAGAANLTELAAALPVVAQHTRYGNVILIRFVLLAIAALAAGGTRFRLRATLALITAALGLQGLIGHAGAIGGAIGAAVVASETLHLTAAGVWLGALVPLWLCIRRLPAPRATAVCVRFSPIGLGCVVILAGTGLAQGVELIGGVTAFLGTTYGRLVLLKIALFACAVVLAALNRLWLTDRLAAGDLEARRRLLMTVGLETLAGLAIVTAAAFLASSPPAAHQVTAWL